MFALGTTMASDEKALQDTYSHRGCLHVSHDAAISQHFTRLSRKRLAEQSEMNQTKLVLFASFMKSES